MNAKASSPKFLRPTTRRLVHCAAPVFAAAIATTPVQAAFHLWNIREIYTDNSGSLQFIELFCPASGQTFTMNQQIRVSNGTTTHTFTVPSNLGSDSLNHAWLFGTAGVHAAGAPTPDFIISDNFLFSGGGTISFFGANGGAYTALPTDGILSRTWGDGNAPNTPQNFAGQVGVVVPEPSTWVMLATGGIGLGLALRRRLG